ncbi:hypothetical protein MINTM008_13530 [Mycobacterium intracellulare]|nr:hypothetical protein MINTM002_11080 [Mycobacterium intracellulare]BCP14425.1 hypothetical protein MINTM021_13340 [Mycobacterium paraintracellulare]BCO55818.1 hypothetical protein MINTM005_10620 [Mycobacterium intracellulare]BCO61266.1 hypothetical protein MINTM006_12160 [Mycobacterium intracellulare]BCO72018.1 hypothetical protein MINTM008_13530 [Mycobacterium intracellulare]
MRVSRRFRKALCTEALRAFVFQNDGARAGFVEWTEDAKRGRTPVGARPRFTESRRQAQLDPTALSVLAMLLPAD